MKRYITIFLLLFALVPMARGEEFILFYSNDLHGETAPCG